MPHRGHDRDRAGALGGGRCDLSFLRPGRHWGAPPAGRGEVAVLPWLGGPRSGLPSPGHRVDARPGEVGAAGLEGDVRATGRSGKVTVDGWVGPSTWDRAAAGPWGTARTETGGPVPSV